MPSANDIARRMTCSDGFEEVCHAGTRHLRDRAATLGQLIDTVYVPDDVTLAPCVWNLIAQAPQMRRRRLTYRCI